MKKSIAILLIFSTSAHCLHRIGILVSFRLNQSRIAITLCENRAKPQLNCNGKCFLAKKLKAAEEQEKKNTPSPKSEKIELFYQETFVFCLEKTESFVLKNTVHIPVSDFPE